MSEKKKFTINIILIILISIALLAMLISCCVLGTKHSFNNSVAYATESNSPFINLDTAISTGFSGVTYYGIRFNSEELPEEHGEADLFSFSPVGSSIIYNVSISNELVYIKNGSNIITVLHDYYLDNNNINTFYLSQGFNIVELLDEEVAPFIINLCTSPLFNNSFSDTLKIIYFNKLSNGNWDTVVNDYISLSNFSWSGDWTDEGGSVMFIGNNINDFIYHSIGNRDENTNEYPFYYKDNKKFKLVYCPSPLALSIGYNKGSLGQYEKGYNKGYSDGYSVGNSEGSIFEESTSFLKNTFTNIGSLLDIKIFGNITLGVVIGIPLIIMVVLAVLKLVRG